MQKVLVYKFLAIGSLTLLLTGSLAMINGVIGERKSYRDRVIKDIARSWTGPQKIIGPVFVAPYKEKVKKRESLYEDDKERTILKEQTLQKYRYILPETIAINGNIKTEERYRGIYRVPVYLADLRLKGFFNTAKFPDITENSQNITWQEPYIILGVEDVRGVNRSVRIRVNNQKIPLLPGTRTSFIQQGIHAPLNSEYYKEQHLSFNIDLELRGMQQLLFLPIAEFTRVDLSSAWPHPGFTGRFLPKARNVNEQGFTASWETSFFASNTPQHLQDCALKNQCKEFKNNAFGVSLIQGVDIYLQAERSIKYALLFIGLTFITFFLFETIKGLPIHAIQYGLVGVALALFYLLLISLSEHIAFGTSYIIASGICAGLLTFYVSFALRSITRGLIFGSALTGLYGALYILIRSEDYALLMGSVLLFAALAFIMIITRHVDWHRIEAGTGQQHIKDSVKKKSGRWL